MFGAKPRRKEMTKRSSKDDPIRPGDADDPWMELVTALADIAVDLEWERLQRRKRVKHDQDD